MPSKVEKIGLSQIISEKIRDYLLLVKVRLTALVVFSAVIAYLISADGDINWNALGVLALGGFLVTAAANALNQVLEREYDKLMKRTADRPLPAGRMTISAALLAAGLMSLVGVALLTSLNPMTGFLGTISLISYAFIYTPMKRVSPIAVFIGAFPGALPMAIGSVAVTGILTSVSLVLFAIQFLWQFPHFWAIAWVGHEDYSKAGFRLLPSHNNELDASIGFYSFLYALALLGVSILPYFMGIVSIFSTLILFFLGVIYAYFSWNLYKKCDKKSALHLMFYSFFYLPIALIAMLFDKI